MEENRLYDSAVKFIKFVCERYANDVGSVEKTIVERLPYRFCVLSCYSQFVASGELVPIEKIEKKVQEELLHKTYDWMPKEENEVELTTMLEMIIYSKRSALMRCIWVINFALEKYFLIPEA